MLKPLADLRTDKAFWEFTTALKNRRFAQGEKCYFLKKDYGRPDGIGLHLPSMEDKRVYG